MAKKSARKLFLFGRYSLAMLLPKKWLTELGVERGDSVALEFDRRRGRIVLRFNQNAETSLENTVVSPKVKKSEPPTDLQPIPEL
ncbi:MAG: AbrB/MazE/SpoVT family DNA-binding domain-containing protein [bacterium]|nr:AbrB/MazE/SpoVT family DNA-binding domain-containing protein [bacterium]